MSLDMPVTDSPRPAHDEQDRRQKRLLEIVNAGLPPFPHTILELTAILSGPSADVKKAAKLIRTDPNLSAQVLRMCNSPLFSLRSRVISIAQAATLLGADRLRTLALTTSMVDFAGTFCHRSRLHLSGSTVFSRPCSVNIWPNAPIILKKNKHTSPD